MISGLECKAQRLLWRSINIMAWNKLQGNKYKSQIKWWRRWKHLISSSRQQVRHACKEEFRRKNKVRRDRLSAITFSTYRSAVGRHVELQMNPLVSVGAGQIRPRDWTRTALYISEITEARFLVLPLLPPTCENNLIAPQAF